MPDLLNEKQLLVARNESPFFMANIAAKGSLKLATPLAFFETKFNVSYEELGCIGYNPNSEELTAIIKIKRSSGFGGNLCSAGSHEYVRFYVDFGAGYKDQGYVGVNVHDIADTFDCDKNLEKPIEFAVRMKLNSSHQLCSKPLLPKVRAVLSWNSIPPANDPNLTQPGYVWGNVKEAQIQIKPLKLQIVLPNLGILLEKSILNPNLSLNNLILNNPIAEKQLADAKKLLTADKVAFSQLITEYKTAKVDVETHRSGFSFLAEALNSKEKSVVENSTAVFAENKIDFSKAMASLIASKGNVSYEELGCVALDYHNEALVATFNAKRNYGYGGNLCSAGSKEYVTFWIKDESTHCQWMKVGTSIVNLHDISGHSGLSYSAILPYDFSKFKLPCGTPRVLKVRAVLSWNVEPTGLDTPYWGNSKESYVQLSPKNWVGNAPKILTIGGVNADFIDNASGLTLANAKFDENQNPIILGSRFMGKISIYGVSAPFAGMKYRIKIVNMDSGASSYVNDPLVLIGYDSSFNTVQTVITPDAANYYTYQSYQINTKSKLALFSPGTNSKLNVIIEHQDSSIDSQVIQMDNTMPAVTMKINDEGECVHFKKGDVILGKFSALDNFIYKFTLAVNGGKFTELKFEGVPQAIGVGEANSLVRTVNVVNGDFKVTTALDKNCGNITLVMEQKTVVDSASMASPVYTNQAFCLKD